MRFSLNPSITLGDRECRLFDPLKAPQEVERVFGKLGRADTATNSSAVSMAETTVLLRPKSAWRKGITKARQMAEMNGSQQVLVPVNRGTQPINPRVLMQDTGIQTAVGH